MRFLRFQRSASSRPRRWRRIAAIALGTVAALIGLVVVAGALVLRSLDRPWIKARLQAAVRSSAGVDIDYRTLRVDLLSGAHVEDLVVESPAEVRRFAPEMLRVGRTALSGPGSTRGDCRVGNSGFFGWALSAVTSAGLLSGGRSTGGGATGKRPPLSAPRSLITARTAWAIAAADAKRSSGFFCIAFITISASPSCIGARPRGSGTGSYFMVFQTREGQANATYRLEVTRQQYQRFQEGDRVRVTLNNNILVNIQPND